MLPGLGARGLSRALISLILHASILTKACRESTSGTQGTVMHARMENKEHMIELVRFIFGPFTVSARNLRKKLYQQYKEYESAK